MDTEETRIYLAVAIATVVISIPLLYLFFQLYKQQKKYADLQQQKSLVEISSLERERARIAADLHDDLGPLLSAIKLQINSLDTLSEEDKKTVAGSSDHLDDAIQRLRQISNDLLPTILSRKGITEAVQELADLHSIAGRLQIDFEYSDDISIPKDKWVHLYRMAQESIFNCIKHAGATRMLLLMKMERSLLRFTITDNGCGINAAQPAPGSGGRGLISLSNRASIMGGHLHIHSEVGKGTILDFEIPVS